LLRANARGDEESRAPSTRLRDVLGADSSPRSARRSVHYPKRPATPYRGPVGLVGSVVVTPDGRVKLLRRQSFVRRWTIIGNCWKDQMEVVGTRVPHLDGDVDTVREPETWNKCLDRLFRVVTASL